MRSSPSRKPQMAASPSSVAATTSRTRTSLGGTRVGPARLDRVERVGVLGDGGAERLGAVAVALVVAQPVLPPGTVAVEHAGYRRADGLVHRAHGVERVSGREQIDLRGRGAAQRATSVSTSSSAAKRRHAIAEAAVDHGLGRPQGGDRLAAAVVDVGELAAHQRGEQPAPAVGGAHADERHARDRHLSARHREPAREDPGPGHDPPAIAQDTRMRSGSRTLLPALAQVLGLTSRWNAE